MKKKTLVLLVIAGIVVAASLSIIVFAITTLNRFHEAGIEAAKINGEDSNEEADSLQEKNHDEAGNSNIGYIDPYIKMVSESNRINVLCLGIAEYSLADTIVVASFDPGKNSLDIISVPRDTYFYRTGFDTGAEKKLNASHYGKNSAERAQSAMNSVRDVLQMPIHHFVKVEYKGVENIVEGIGGVEVNIPFDMNYDDPMDDLYIHFKKGEMVLNGEDAVKYLRFRKNNDNTNSDGDIGRIKRQQQFILAAFKKTMGKQLLKTVDIAKEYIRTSMTAEEMLSYARELSSVRTENIKTYILPGESEYIDRFSYYIQDKSATREMITSIYNKQSIASSN